jgi:hypothetical protein
MLCGIGFTMSLFIGTLAFEQQGLEYQTSVKMGVLMGSILSAIIGAFVLTKAKPKPKIVPGTASVRPGKLQILWLTEIILEEVFA